MKITPKGIGWLIFGVIVCASSTEAIGIVSALSTIALGLVFILIYVMKQFFKPRSIGWYILGGMLLAFCIESGYNSDTLIALIAASASLGWFYYRNKEALDYMLSGMTTDEIGDFSYVDEDTYPEPAAYETVEEVVEEITNDSADIPETDISVIETPDELFKSKPAKTNSSASKTTGSKTNKSTPAGSKPAAPKTVASKASETEPAASKTAEPKPAASKATEPKAAASIADESKPAASKAIESKPAASKSAESKPTLQTYPPEGPEEPIVEFEVIEEGEKSE